MKMTYKQNQKFNGYIVLLIILIMVFEEYFIHFTF